VAANHFNRGFYEPSLEPLDEAFHVRVPRGLARMVAAQASHAEDLERLFRFEDELDDQCRGAA
jgi:hypothetical protein